MRDLILNIIVNIFIWCLLVFLTITNFMLMRQVNKMDAQVSLLTQQTMSLLIKQGYEAERSGR
jgi:hypothetical protein